ncbi:MAG: NAD(P)-dependent oxidoreductase [Desulfomonile tiedjei]|nr:NAD(P)-dependent oxidoreductase [Desulfomonile tiedjei]
MKALVTGATGFIGSHMAELLLADGWDVVCPVRNMGTHGHVEGLPVCCVPVSELEAQLRKQGPVDYVFHIAGATRATTYQGYRAANVEMTRSLLELFARDPWKHVLKRFILVSSQAAAGPSDEQGTPVTEADPPSPLSLYGRSKLEAEEVALSFRGRLPVTIVRPSTVFGPRDRDVLGVFKAARLRLAPYISGPARRVSIIYVEDLTHGILVAALSARAEGRTYFLANSDPVVWREFALDVARVMGCKALALPVPLSAMKVATIVGEIAGRLTGSAKLLRPEKLEEMRQLAWICSADRAFRELNWKACTPLDQAIAKTSRWYKTHGWV